MYLLNVSDKEYAIYSCADPMCVSLVSENRAREMYTIDDLQNAKEENGVIVPEMLFSEKDIFILCEIISDEFKGYKVVLYNNDSLDGTIICLKEITSEQLKDMVAQGYTVVNAAWNAGEYKSFGVDIPVIHRGRDEETIVLNNYGVIYQHYLERLYEVYCKYVSSEPSPRKPAKFEELDKSDWHWLRSIMKVHHNAEYNDWMRMLSLSF